MTKKQRIIFSLLSIWSFVHLVLYLLGGKEVGISIWEYGDKAIGSSYHESEGHIYIEHTSQFFPFESNFSLHPWGNEINRLEYYDLTELLVYAVSPWLFFGLYKFIQKGK
jgi:hypothetical protein